MQCSAVWCNVVQCGAMWCSALAHTMAGIFKKVVSGLSKFVAVLQCVAVCCSVTRCVGSYNGWDVQEVGVCLV